MKFRLIFFFYLFFSIQVFGQFQLKNHHLNFQYQPFDFFLNYGKDLKIDSLRICSIHFGLGIRNAFQGAIYPQLTLEKNIFNFQKKSFHFPLGARFSSKTLNISTQNRQMYWSESLQFFASLSFGKKNQFGVNAAYGFAMDHFKVNKSVDFLFYPMPSIQLFWKNEK